MMQAGPSFAQKAKAFVGGIFTKKPQVYAANANNSYGSENEFDD